MNEEVKVKRKDWIKNVAIVFLSVMLVLTFFSNTILNYSLPEVATANVQPGSVTSRIRGTGTLTSEDPYKVTVQESRVIAGVAVKQGETVEKGQVLFYLEDKESAELKEAESKLRTLEAELDALILAYSSGLLKGEVSNQSYQNIQNGVIASDNAYQARIDAAKQKVEGAKATVDSLTRQIAIAGTGVGNNNDQAAQLEQARAAMASAEVALSAAQEQLAAVSGMDATELHAELKKFEQNTDYTDALKNYEEARTWLQNAINTGQTALGQAAVTVADLTTQANWDAYLTSLQMNYIEKYTDDGGPDPSDPNEKDAKDPSNKKKFANAKLNDLRAAYGAYLPYHTEYTKLQNQYNQSLTVPALQVAVTNAQNRYNESNSWVKALEAEASNNTASLSQQKAELEAAKINAEAGLKQAEAELAQLLTDIGNELTFSGQNEVIRLKQDEVRRQREEVEELIAKSQGTTVVAPVAGIVTGITVTAGETTSPDKELATMQPAGKGYSLSFSVTNEQAQKVKVGDPAELQNAWYFGDVTVSLTAIRPDPDNPGQNKLLVFSVEGEVQTGQSLSLVVGQRSANYDMIVPNSALREDNNGKFILVVESRNSPLGNRYIATRTDVEVMAADELNSAISAPLYGHEYVITTATKPVEAGKEVRLAENN